MHEHRVNSSDNLGKHTTLSWTLQGVTLLGVLGGIFSGGIWVGQIQTKLEYQAERLSRVENTLGQLNDKIDRLLPKPTAKESEGDIEKLTARINVLQNQVSELKQVSEVTAIKSARERDGANLLRTKLSGASAQLSEISSDVEHFAKLAPRKEDNLPERYVAYLNDNLARIQKKLEDLRSSLEK
jgi:chromosome segregation ATPase